MGKREKRISLWHGDSGSSIRWATATVGEIICDLIKDSERGHTFPVHVEATPGSDKDATSLLLGAKCIQLGTKGLCGPFHVQQQIKHTDLQ